MKATSLNLQTALLCIFIALMALVFLATVSRSMLKHSYYFYYSQGISIHAVI